jgi:O-acetyl-ADP-ribose deacetylase (regulator of RNase III)
MDLALLRTSVFDLPSQKRVGAIVYDGAADLQLWPGPGPDTELAAAWGDDLQGALDLERRRAKTKLLELGEVLRVPRGRLHCDFLLWAATRPPEPGVRREPAPSLDLVEAAAMNAFRFAAARDVERIAFPPLGSGPDERDRADRIAAIARAARKFEEECRALGKSTVIEEVLLCEPQSTSYRRAAELLRGRATSEAAPPAIRRNVAAPTKRASGGGRKKSGLDEAEVARNRLSAEPYSMKARYSAGDWFVHPKFGVGKVERVIDASSVEVRFEDGSLKKLVHARA